MTRPSTRHLLLSLPLVAALFAVPVTVAGQSDLDASEAEEFMGDWQLPLNTDFGPIDISMTIENVDGRVAVTVGSPEFGMESVTDVERTGDQLVLTYEVDAQGQYVNVSMTLERSGDGLDVSIDAADGQFLVTGTAQRASR